MIHREILRTGPAHANKAQERRETRGPGSRESGELHARTLVTSAVTQRSGLNRRGRGCHRLAWRSIHGLRHRRRRSELGSRFVASHQRRQWLFRGPERNQLDAWCAGPILLDGQRVRQGELDPQQGKVEVPQVAQPGHQRCVLVFPVPFAWVVRSAGVTMPGRMVVVMFDQPLRQRMDMPRRRRRNPGRDQKGRQQHAGCDLHGAMNHGEMAE